MKRWICMNKTVIDKDKLQEIVQGSYRELKKKDRTGATKQATVAEIIRMIERTLKDGD